MQTSAAEISAEYNNEGSFKREKKNNRFDNNRTQCENDGCGRFYFVCVCAREQLI